MSSALVPSAVFASLKRFAAILLVIQSCALPFLVIDSLL